MKLEIARRAVVGHDACTTVSTCDGNDKKKTVTVVRTVSRSRAAIQKPVHNEQKTQNGTYGDRSQLEVLHFSKTHASKQQNRIIFRTFK